MRVTTCADCGDAYDRARWALGYYTCKDCGDAHAKALRASWCVTQLYSKGNYQLVTDPSDLKRTNPKRTT
jgi:ribosomal protein L37AE/L43A